MLECPKNYFVVIVNAKYCKYYFAIKIKAVLFFVTSNPLFFDNVWFWINIYETSQYLFKQQNWSIKSNSTYCWSVLFLIFNGHWPLFNIHFLIYWAYSPLSLQSQPVIMLFTYMLYIVSFQRVWEHFHPMTATFFTVDFFLKNVLLPMVMFKSSMLLY